MRASCPRPPFISDLPFHTSLLCDSRFGTLHLASQASLTWPYTTAFSALLPNYASSDNGRPARAPHLIESSDSWMRRARCPLRCLPPISLSLRVLSSTKPSVTTCTRQLCITHSEFHVPHPPSPNLPPCCSSNVPDTYPPRAFAPAAMRLERLLPDIFCVCSLTGFGSFPFRIPAGYGIHSRSLNEGGRRG